MSKSKKMFLRIMPVMLMVFVLVGNVYGLGTLPESDTSIGAVDDLANSIWGTVIVIANILAFAAIIFAGIRYMFAPADVKGDIKEQTVILVVGALLVFAAQPIVNFIAGLGSDVLN